MSVAHARNSDPRTSHEAAESVKETTPLKERILYLFGEAKNGFIDEELIEAYDFAFGARYRASEASLRSRRSELHHENHLTEAKLHDEVITRKTKAGRNSTVWILTGRLF